MLISSLIVRVKPDSAENIVIELKKFPNASTHGIYKNENIVIIVESETEEKLQDFSRYILHEYEDILGVFPTFMAAEENLDYDN